MFLEGKRDPAGEGILLYTKKLNIIPRQQELQQNSKQGAILVCRGEVRHARGGYGLEGCKMFLKCC